MGHAVAGNNAFLIMDCNIAVIAVQLLWFVFLFLSRLRYRDASLVCLSFNRVTLPFSAES